LKNDLIRHPMHVGHPVPLRVAPGMDYSWKSAACCGRMKKEPWTQVHSPSDFFSYCPEKKPHSQAYLHCPSKWRLLQISCRKEPPVVAGFRLQKSPELKFTNPQNCFAFFLTLKNKSPTLERVRTALPNRIRYRFLVEKSLVLWCRVAKTDSIPYLYRSFSAKVTYI